jgi:hypothetical protein
MEIILEVLCQFFGDIILQIVCELILEFSQHKFTKTAEPEKCMPIVAFFGYGVLGLFAGGLSLFLFPHPFVRSSRFHGISLLITPLIAGLAMSGVGWLRKRQGTIVLRIDTFIYGFIFAFGIALTRYIAAK